MEEGDKQLPKSGLPEALNPEIGNSSYWELNPHFLSLRSVDPTKSLGDEMIDEEERSGIIAKWSGKPVPPIGGTDTEPVSQENEELPVRHKDKGKKKHKKVHSVTKSKETEADWMQEEETIKTDPTPPGMDPEEQAAEESITRAEEVPAEKPGKRIRKVVKGAERAEKQPVLVKTSVSPVPMESALSPFTRWLKGLRGSEYVHPYEDDYALDQRAGNTKDGISETFADLLAAQGYREQAIDMYRLLMAKYPEKSSFFAAKIEAL